MKARLLKKYNMRWNGTMMGNVHLFFLVAVFFATPVTLKILMNWLNNVCCMKKIS
jgi:fructose-1,6-bisphosphatase